MQPRELEHAKSDELIQSASSLKISFGFKGKRPSRNSITGSTDEILDSLTRHAKLMEEAGKDRILGLQTVLEVESEGSTPNTRILRQREYSNLRKPETLESTPSLMLVGGLTFLWIYSRLSESLNLQTLATLQQTISRVGFTNWQKNHTHRVFLHSSLLFLPVAQDEGYAHVYSEMFMCMQIPLGHKGQPSLAQQVARGRFELPSAGDSYPIL